MNSRQIAAEYLLEKQAGSFRIANTMARNARQTVEGISRQKSGFRKNVEAVGGAILPTAVVGGVGLASIAGSAISNAPLGE